MMLMRRRTEREEDDEELLKSGTLLSPSFVSCRWKEEEESGDGESKIELSIGQ